jgi:hypothetical protein
VAVGNATARAISFRDREKRTAIYPNSQWQSLSAVTDYQWLDKEAEGARNLDARTKFFYGYTVNTPAMMAKLVGRGSLLNDAGNLLGAWASRAETSIFRVDMGFLLAMLPPGAFISFGLLLAARNWIRQRRS